MRIKRHIPNACSGLEASEEEFNTLDELLEIPWVKSFRLMPFNQESGETNKYFKRYSLSPYYGDTYLLMAEFDTNEIWRDSKWVIGYIELDCQEFLNLQLPLFGS